MIEVCSVSSEDGLFDFCSIVDGFYCVICCGFLYEGHSRFGWVEDPSQFVVASFDGLSPFDSLDYLFFVLLTFEIVLAYYRFKVFRLFCLCLLSDLSELFLGLSKESLTFLFCFWVGCVVCCFHFCDCVFDCCR